MVIGPDKGDLPVMRKLCRETGCDVWFPFYPLCMEHCITETYAMVYECYRKMIALYGGGNVSTCGFSSGGALALGIAAHNNAQPEPLPQPRHIVAVSPGEVPWNDAERARMQALNELDVSIDYAFMVAVEKFMRHGCENVPDYMLSGSRGDFTGVGDIHFFYSADEVLYGALPDFEEACKRANVPYTVSARPKMVETITVNGFPCLIVRENPNPSKRAILYFFGGGMVIGPDKGDLPVMRKLCRETGCDVWFPFYPLCMEHCITETYAMVYECYRKMIALYGGGNVSTCGFSSGGALALGIAAHNNAQPEPLPQPRHIVAVSPGEVPWNDAEKARMQALNKRDVSIDYAFMVTVEKFMRHGCENVPDYMLSGSRRPSALFFIFSAAAW